MIRSLRLIHYLNLIDQQLYYYRSMGQNITENAQSLHRSLQLYKLSKLQLAFQSIIPFLNSLLSQDDIKSLSRLLQNFIRQNGQLFKNYLSWLYKQAEKRKEKFDNICSILTISKKVCSDLNLVQLAQWIDSLNRNALFTLYYDKGVQFHKKNEYQQAMAQFDKLLTFYPDESELYFNKGVIYLRLNKIKQSEQSFLKAIQLKKDYQSAYFNLLTVYQIQKDQVKQQTCFKQLFKLKPKDSKYQQRYVKFLHRCWRWKQVIPIYKKMIRQNPSDGDLINQFNQAIKAAQKYSDGCEIYKYLTQIEPTNCNYFYNVGLCYKDMEKYDEAIEWLTKGLKIKDNHLAQYYLSLIFQDLQMEEQMFQCYEKAIRLNSKYSKIFQKIGDYFAKNQHYLAQSLQFYQEQANHDIQNLQIYYDLGRQEFNKGEILKSIEYYKKAVQIQPEKYYSYLLLASSNNQVKKYDEAILHLQIAIGLKPDCQEIYNLFGNAYFGKGRLSLAISNYKKAIEINPKSQFPYFNLGLTYFNEFQYKEALQYFQKCIKANPLYSSAFYLISAIYMRQNQPQKAIKFLQNVIQQNPTNYQSFLQLGSTYFQIWDYQQSLKYFKRAHSLNEKHPTAIYNTGIVLALLFKYQQGLKWIQKALSINSRDRYYQCGYGICLLKMQRYEEAIHAFYKTINCYPEYYQPYFHLGKALKLSKKQLSELQNYTDLVTLKQEKVQLIQCIGLFDRGIGDINLFFTNFNKILAILKEGLFQNQKEGKRKICKFINDFVHDIDCILRDYFQFDLVILSGVLYRDIGDTFRSKECFNKVINHQNYNKNGSFLQKMIALYQISIAKIKWFSFDYYTLLIQFMLQQILQENQPLGYKCYKQLVKRDADLAQDQSLSNLIYHKRQQKAQQLRSIIQQEDLQYFRLQKSGKKYEKIKIILGQISKKIVNLTGQSEERHLKIKQFIKKMNFYDCKNMGEITQQLILKQVNIKQESAINKCQQIINNKQPVGDKIKEINQILQQYLKNKLVDQIALFLFHELFQVMNLQQKVLSYFTSLVVSFCKNKINKYQIFTQIDNIIEKHSKIILHSNSNVLYDRKNYVIDLQSSAIYEDYQFQKSSSLIKTTATLNKSVESKLSTDIIKPKQKVNKKSLALISGIQPYSYQNIFQRKLVKGKQAKSSIYVGSTKISGFNSIYNSSKAFQSQILQDFDEGAFD